MMNITEYDKICFEISERLQKLQDDIAAWEANYTIVDGDDTAEYATQCKKNISNMLWEIRDVNNIADYIINIERRKAQYEA